MAVPSPSIRALAGIFLVPHDQATVPHSTPTPVSSKVESLVAKNLPKVASFFNIEDNQIDKFQTEYKALTARAKSLAPSDKFSHFVHADEASRIYDFLLELEKKIGFDNTCNLISRVFNSEKVNKELIHYAVEVFLAHSNDSNAKNNLPNIMLVHSSKFFEATQVHQGKIDTSNNNNVRTVVKSSTTETDPFFSPFQTGSNFDPEYAVAWWREDPWLNSHHWHWHIVYPGNGVLGKAKDRQGELFYFMHQQLLARYNAERVGAMMARVQPLAYWHEPVPEGYDAHLTNVYGAAQYGPRPSTMKWPEVIVLNGLLDGGSRVYKNDMESWRDRLYDAIDSGYFFNWNPVGPPPTDKRDPNGDSSQPGNVSSHRIPVDINLLGFSVEADSFAVKQEGSNTRYYGNLHNMGHMFTASMSNSNGLTNSAYGVMSDTATAVRDPVFFRWHKFVDDIYFRHLSTLTPYSFSDTKRNGLLPGDTDIELASIEIIPSVKGNLPFISLRTYMKDVELDLSQSAYDSAQPEGVQAAPSYAIVTVLDHDQFAYKFTVNNTSDKERKITVRVWMGAANSYNRRGMIEMDKFVTTVPAKTSAFAINRNSSESTVLQAVIPSADLFPDSDQTDTNSYCKCGVPPNLLLPKGRPEGMGFSLFVMVTDWTNDRVGDDSCPSCSSEYCGLKNKMYPDKRPMGFPFDRRWVDENRGGESETNFIDFVKDAVAANQNMKMLQFQIRFDSSYHPVEKFVPKTDLKNLK